MIAHFTAIADAAALPMILYNIPGRSVVDMGNETIATLAKHKHIVGVKDATGNVARVAELVAMAGKDFCQLSGNDDCVAGFLAQGGHGVISVVSNVAPRMHADMVEAWEAGDLKTFAALRDSLRRWHVICFARAVPRRLNMRRSVWGFVVMNYVCH